MDRKTGILVFYHAVLDPKNILRWKSMCPTSFGRETNLGFALSPRRNPGLSVTRTALIKSAVAGRSIAYSTRMSPAERRKLAPLKRYTGCFGDLDALLIAGGPSASTIDPETVNGLQKLGHLHVFAINKFFASILGSVLKPDFYVLSDPVSGPTGQLGSWREEVFQSYPVTTLFVPSHWHYEDEAEFRFANQIVRFENRSLEGWGSGCDPTKLRRYLGLSTLCAMSIATFMGYRKIGIIGLDATHTVGLSVDAENQMFIKPVHHEGAGGPGFQSVSRRLGESGKYQGTYRNASDLFFGEATLHDHLDRFFSPEGCFVNLSEESVVTSFPRQLPSEFLSEVASRR